MLHHLKQICGHTLVTGLVVALASTFMACEFGAPGAFEPDTPEGINEILNMAPVTSLDKGDRWTVYEVPGKIRVQHGFGCVTRDHAVSKEYIAFRIQDSETVPTAFADTGTIILNGWDVRYTDDDHHVLGLGTWIFNVTEIHSVDLYELRWEAGGVLTDRDGKDAYEWCYTYSLVFWNRSVFDAIVPPQTDLSTTYVASTFGSNTTLIDLHGNFPKLFSGPQAVVPRGFGFVWNGTDHEVLQVGFDLGPPTPVSTGNEISWTSQAILKDDSTYRAYNAAELVTVLNGQDVELWQPSTVLHLAGAYPNGEVENELKLQPWDPCGGCTGNGDKQYLESYSVENVPFAYAVPVLTGWDLHYETEDHHVKRIGVYLVDFEYVPDPKTKTGTLNYTISSILKDDSSNGHGAQYQVSILGFN